VQHQIDWNGFRRATAHPAPHGARLGRSGLIAVARDLATDEDRWRALVRHDPQRRWFVRLHATPSVEAWLITWTTAQGLELHDHGGSCGAVSVVEGELTEDYTDLVAGVPLRRNAWRRGSVVTFGPDHVHDLRNLSPHPATSIHVYSPPLSSMTFYERDAAERLIPTRIECVGASTRAAARLHQ
jgi:predicted metal-dependent enzyme (double-stranded beta helix superfamily)